jgi:hypothetical protein
MANANTMSQILQRAIAKYHTDCAQPVGISGTAMGLKHETTKSDEYISARDHSTDIDATSRIAPGYKREYCRRAKVRITRVLSIHTSGLQSLCQIHWTAANGRAARQKCGRQATLSLCYIFYA